MSFVIEWVKMYFGSGWHWLLLLLAVGVILISKKAGKNKKLMLGFSAIFIVLYACPITAKIITKYCIEEEVYWRMFWILPIALILAYAGTLLCESAKKETIHLAVLLGIVTLMILSGKCMYGQGQYQKDTNKFKIENKVLAASKLIREHAQEGEMVQAVGSYDFICYMRQYDAGILQPYGRYEPGYEPAITIRKEFEKEKADIAVLTQACKNCRTNYIIYPSDEEENQQFISYGYLPIGKAENHTVYKWEEFLPYN